VDNFILLIKSFPTQLFYPQNRCYLYTHTLTYQHSYPHIKNHAKFLEAMLHSYPQAYPQLGAHLCTGRGGADCTADILRTYSDTKKSENRINNLIIILCCKYTVFNKKNQSRSAERTLLKPA
jgi:hypothetical protein